MYGVELYAAVVDECLNHRYVTWWFGIDRRTVKMMLTGDRSWRTWTGPDGNRRTRSSFRCLIRRAMPRWTLARRRWRSGPATAIRQGLSEADDRALPRQAQERPFLARRGFAIASER